ncbi:DHHW family protein [Paenibacillus koleovorans]|uniref:DHHW family protein n=1 Tax=Paenibacillus koleovorans TaxID=121608 RepID=UPI000FD6FA0E|nr:DHHW family protein [Paenibacillus koleovorans]
MRKMNLLLFLVPVFAMFVLNLAMPKGPEISELEKRSLKPFPSFTMGKLFDGSYFKEFDDYFADHFVFRSPLVQAGAQLKELRGLQGEEQVSIVVQKGNNMFKDQAKGSGGAGAGANAGTSGGQGGSAGTAAGTGATGTAASGATGAGGGTAAGGDTAARSGGGEPASSVASATTAPGGDAASPQPSSGTADAGAGGGASVPANAGAKPAPAESPAPGAKEGVQDTEYERYLVLKDRAMTLFEYAPSSGEKFAQVINRFQQQLDPKVRVYDILVPSPVEFISDAKYRSLSSSQKASINQVNKFFNSKVTPIDALGELNKHASEYIYFRTDHHWTQLGAYYGYKAFIERIGEKAVPLDQFETGELPGYLGSAYSATLDPNLKKNPDTIKIYKPNVPYDYTLYWEDDHPLKRNVVDLEYATHGGGGYQVFLEGDSPWGHIETENKNGKKLLLVKDSYGSPFIPFLLPHFEHIYFVDPRHYWGSILQFAADKEITDLLFINGIAAVSHDGYVELLLSKE